MYLGTSLGKSEDVIDEQQYILTFLISEILGDSESSKGHSARAPGGSFICP